MYRLTGTTESGEAVSKEYDTREAGQQAFHYLDPLLGSEQLHPVLVTLALDRLDNGEWVNVDYSEI